MPLKNIPFPSQEGGRSQLSPVWKCTCNNAPIRDILVSPQGVVCVAADSNIHLYAGAPSFGASHTLALSAGHLTAYAFSADGTHFLTGDSEGYIKWWDVHNGEVAVSTRFPYEKPLRRDAVDLPGISSIVCCTQHQIVAVAAGNALSIYGEAGKHLHSIGPLDSAIQSLQWKSPDELAVNIGDAVCMIRVETASYQPCKKYPNEVKEGNLKILACSPKGNMFAAGCTKGLVRIWDLVSERDGEISILVKGLPKADVEDVLVQCLEWDSTGRYLSAAGGSDIIVWDMMDSGEEDRDDSIVCYGHGQSSKITALCFQPEGQLLATGGDDCQVLVFDSSNFVSNGVVGGLVESSASGKIRQTQSGTAITALAWHPSGLILAGTNDGYVDAFEVAGAIHETPRATNGNAPEMPFLITRPKTDTKHPQQKQYNGWGGEPLPLTRNENSPLDKAYHRRRVLATGAMSGPMRTGAKPKVIVGNYKSPHPVPTYATEPAGARVPAGWQNMIRPPNVMRWPGMHPQVQAPYPPQPAMPYADTSTNLPHTPESNNSEGTNRGGVPPGPPAQHRNDRTPNKNGNVDSPTPMMHGALMSPYPPGYVPYPSPYPMGYPMPPYCYPYQMHPQMVADGMHAVMPGYAAPPFARPPVNLPPKAPQHRDTAGKTENVQKDGHGDVEEEQGSKSSEAANNGVNHAVMPTPHPEAAPAVYPDGRQNQGQTLYVGNLASMVDDDSYGPVGQRPNSRPIRRTQAQGVILQPTLIRPSKRPSSPTKTVGHKKFGGVAVMEVENEA